MPLRTIEGFHLPHCLFEAVFYVPSETEIKLLLCCCVCQVAHLSGILCTRLQVLW